MTLFLTKEHRVIADGIDITDAASQSLNALASNIMEMRFIDFTTGEYQRSDGEIGRYDPVIFQDLIALANAEVEKYLAQKEPVTADKINLTPRQFNYFTARWGYDDAITAVLAALKANDIETYARVKADVVGAGEYRFDNVLAVIGNPVVAPVIPQGVDVSAETLAARWLEASNV